MSHTHRIVSPGYRKRTVFSENGEVLTPPEDWSFLPAGDSGITRKVKSLGATWVVQVKKGKRKISKGIWAKTSDIEDARQQVNASRSTPEYAQRQKREQDRRERKQLEFETSFYTAVLQFLNFHPRFEKEAEKLAELISTHAAPVGSGTVARSSTRSLEYKAEAAVFAWLRHQTTSYDSLKIPRIRGRRKEVRRELARMSRELLGKYRRGEAHGTHCPLWLALAKTVE